MAMPDGALRTGVSTMRDAAMRDAAMRDAAMRDAAMRDAALVTGLPVKDCRATAGEGRF